MQVSLYSLRKKLRHSSLKSVSGETGLVECIFLAKKSLDQTPRAKHAQLSLFPESATSASHYPWWALRSDRQEQNSSGEAPGRRLYF